MSRHSRTEEFSGFQIDMNSGKMTLTWKMSLMVFIILMKVTGSSIIVQFFFVSRFYVITDYTRQRIETIQMRAEEISQYGFSKLELSETSEIRDLLDRFEAENNVSCLLMDSTGDVICKSDMMYSENSLS